MKIVIDANRLIAALIKEGMTRKILLNAEFQFISPDYLLSEINKYREELLKKTNLAPEDFETLVEMLFEYIEIIPRDEYDSIIEKYKGQLRDEGDLPYLATCAALEAEGIWTHDPHLLQQSIVKTFTNIHLLQISGNQKN